MASFFETLGQNTGQKPVFLQELWVFVNAAFSICLGVAD